MDTWNSILRGTSSAISHFKRMCGAIGCTKPPSHSSPIACAKCNMPYCSEACRRQAHVAGTHRHMCVCYQADLLLLRDPLSCPCVRLLEVEGGAPSDAAPRLLDSFFSRSPAQILVVEALLRRWDLKDALVERKDAIACVLFDLSVFGTFEVADLPETWKAASAFAREMLIHYAALVLPNSSPNVVQCIVHSFILSIRESRSVDSRLNEMLLPLVKHLIANKDLLHSNLDRTLSSLVTSTFRAAGGPAGLSPPQWKLLEGIVRACPSSVCWVEGLFRLQPIAFDRLADEARAGRRIGLVCTIADAGEAFISKRARVVLDEAPRGGRRSEEEYMPSMEALVSIEAVSDAVNLLSRLAAALPTAPILRSDITFANCVNIMVALQYCNNMSYFASEPLATLAIVVGTFMVGSDPTRCASAATVLAEVLMWRRLPPATWDDPGEEASARLHSLLNFAIEHSPIDMSFLSPLGFAVRNILINSPPSLPQVPKLARLVRRRSADAGRRISADMAKYVEGALPLHLKRLCGILEGAPRACENPLCHLKTKLWRCSRCHGIRYCSRECQRAHFPEHKLVCSVPVPFAFSE